MISVRCKSGDLVEVRSAEEILSTLDGNGCLDSLPFMPEMLQYCGRRSRVAASAHKTCDSTYYGQGRLMKDAVFLDDLFCHGGDHGGCEARCLIFFKLKWLKPVEPGREWELECDTTCAPQPRGVDWLLGTTSRRGHDGERLYRCQATEHLTATAPFAPNDFRVFVADVRSRNATIGAVLRGWLLLTVWRLRQLPVGWRFWTGLYEMLHQAMYGTESPHVQGLIPNGSPTPQVRIDVERGELVRVRSLSDIRATLNVANRNRGLSFNAEIAPFCGGTFKVEQRVNRIIDEKSGRMLRLKGPCIMLEGVRCMARYHPEALLCRRRIPQYFREAWLERAEQPSTSNPP